MASLIMLVVILVIVGLVFWLIGMLPIDARLKQAAQVIFVIFAILWVLSIFMGYAPDTLRIRP